MQENSHFPRSGMGKILSTEGEKENAPVSVSRKGIWFLCGVKSWCFGEKARTLPFLQIYLVDVGQAGLDAGLGFEGGVEGFDDLVGA